MSIFPGILSGKLLRTSTTTPSKGAKTFWLKA
ncbi:Uncharacterised protein [Staphylococcus devriesei]|nr:Uncharacterised protein [Staphylococcus devriesei]